MDLAASALHALHLGGSLPAHARFRRALGDPERAQRERLAAILHVLADTQWGPLGDSYETFRAKAFPGTYADLEASLLHQRADGSPGPSPRCARWQPTSGSTDRRKWIPYPPQFLAELDAAAGAWLVDLALRHPGAFTGQHYWSLSWLPAELRAEGADSDDLSLLPAWKRRALGRVMAVPPAVASLPTSADALRATAAWLAARSNLALLSVWSPTFALALVRILSEDREAIAETLRTGAWDLPIPAPRNPPAARLLEDWDGVPSAAFLTALWPRLRLVSAWDSAASAAHAVTLAGLLPRAAFQGKGLWATEGVVSLPFQERLPLALTSHFLEFRCLATGRLLPAWALEEGQELQPLLTTSGGLVRYGLEDRVKVAGFLERTPCLAFLGRLGGTDLVGEKLDASAVSELLADLGDRHGVRCLTLFAVEGDRPGYCLVAEGRPDLGTVLAQDLEPCLARHHHYLLARELEQLAPARALVLPEGEAFLSLRATRLGLAAGAAKVASLQAWSLPISPEQLLKEMDKPR